MWFTETPWPPILIGSVLAVLLVAAWQATGRASHLIGVAALAVLSGGVYLAERWIVTPAEEIEAAVYGLATSFQQRNLEACLDHISASAPLDRGLVAGAMNLVEVEDDLRITDLSVDMKAENSRGISHFRANATVSVKGFGNQGRQPTRWLLTWQREAGRWRVIRIQRLNTITGEPIGNPLASRE
jgi:hypothetical protein